MLILDCLLADQVSADDDRCVAALLDVVLFACDVRELRSSLDTREIVYTC